jgi:hypothetical protein
MELFHRHSSFLISLIKISVSIVSIYLNKFTNRNLQNLSYFLFIKKTHNKTIPRKSLSVCHLLDVMLRTHGKPSRVQHIFQTSFSCIQMLKLLSNDGCILVTIILIFIGIILNNYSIFFLFVSYNTVLNILCLIVSWT